MIHLRHGLVLLAMLSFNVNLVNADQDDDAIEREIAEGEAKAAEWAESQKLKTDTPCMKAWKSNSANHTCLSSTIKDELNNECTFTSITCPRAETSPDDSYSTDSKGDGTSAHVRTSVIYEDLRVHKATVENYFNCDGILTVPRSKEDTEPCKK